ncbi:MAG: hypothetical protein DCC75_04240 [Proteobacteria bacterium]|nr:MAG: hypothetical protein DCC75_04240 [Pseudomonadota bacterium]
MKKVLFTTTFKVMGGPAEIQLYAESEPQAQAVFEAITAELQRIEAKYSRYKGDSILSQINAAAGQKPTEVDEETAALIDYAATCFKESGGLFDITSGVLRRAWNFLEKRVPSDQELATILPLIGWSKVKWNKPSILLPEGMEIDLGGIGKEYAVDKAAAICKELGVTYALINLAGDVRAIGPQADGSPWRVGITHPRKEDSVIKVVDLFSGALATSGDYERYFEVDGKRYCHILSPKSGMPANSFQSVSVLTDSCLVAGTISTITMLKGEAAGLDYLESLGVNYIVVGTNGNMHFTNANNASR